MRRETRLVLLTAAALLLGGWPSTTMGGRGVSGSGGGASFPDVNGVEARYTQLLTDPEFMAGCGEPLNLDESADTIANGWDSDASNNSSECWERSDANYMDFDTAGDQPFAAVTWGSVDYAIDQSNQFMWWYGYNPLTAASNGAQRICYRYYKQVDSDYASTGGDPGNPNGACPNTTWRNKMFQWDINGHQTQLEENPSFNCPALGSFRGLVLGPDNGPLEGEYGLQNAGTTAKYDLGCIDGPCRFEGCVSGDLSTGTAITEWASMHSVSTGLTYTRTIGPANHGGGITNRFLWGGDLFHSGPNNARVGMFLMGAWSTDEGQTLGCSPEVEGTTACPGVAP